MNPRTAIAERLCTLPPATRLRAWDRIGRLPAGVDWSTWIVDALDAAITAELSGSPIPADEPEAGPGRGGSLRGKTWPAACAGTGQPPARVYSQQRTWELNRSGRLHTSPGRGSCPVCGRNSAYTEANGVRRHGEASTSACA